MSYTIPVTSPRYSVLRQGYVRNIAIALKHAGFAHRTAKTIESYFHTENIHSLSLEQFERLLETIPSHHFTEAQVRKMFEH